MKSSTFSRSRSLLTAIAAMLTAACNGGGGGTADTGPADAGIDGGGADGGGADGGTDAAVRASVWSCLPLASFPTPDGPSSTFTMTFWDIEGVDVTHASVGTTIDACAAGDEACASPLSTATTDASGRATLTVPTLGAPWAGFLSIHSAVSTPAYLFLHPPMWYDGLRWTGPWAVPDATDLAALAGTITIDPARGHVLVLTADCCYLERGAAVGCNGGSDAHDVVVTLDGVAADLVPTNDYASFFFNVEPGPALVEARVRGTGELVGRSEIFVVAGGFSETVVGPTPAVPAGFDCVGSVTWPAAPAASLDATFHSFENPGAPIGDGLPFAGLDVAACAAGSDCATPLDTGVTDATGAVTLTLPTPAQGFTGYLRATATGHLPTRMMFYPPIATAASRWLDASHHKAVLSGADIEALIGGGFTYDAAHAVVIATTIDCGGVFSDAVTVTLDGQPPTFAESGDSVWPDVTPGTVHLVAQLRATGQIIARIDAEAVAGEITAVHFGPMPTP